MLSGNIGCYAHICRYICLLLC